MSMKRVVSAGGSASPLPGSPGSMPNAILALLAARQYLLCTRTLLRRSRPPYTSSPAQSPRLTRLGPASLS